MINKLHTNEHHLAVYDDLITTIINHQKVMKYLSVIFVFLLLK